MYDIAACVTGRRLMWKEGDSKLDPTDRESLPSRTLDPSAYRATTRACPDVAIIGLLPPAFFACTCTPPNNGEGVHKNCASIEFTFENRHCHTLTIGPNCYSRCVRNVAYHIKNISGDLLLYFRFKHRSDYLFIYLLFMLCELNETSMSWSSIFALLSPHSSTYYSLLSSWLMVSSTILNVFHSQLKTCLFSKTFRP